MSDGFEPVLAALAAAGLPGVEEGPSYGTPGLKVKGKFLCRLKEPGVLVLRMELDEKEMRMQAEPDTFFETDHYKGYPAVLIRLERIDTDRLAVLLESAWRMQAPKKLLAARPPLRPSPVSREREPE